MRETWQDEYDYERDERPRGRNTDSSVAAQYEDLILPETGQDHDRDS